MVVVTNSVCGEDDVTDNDNHSSDGAGTHIIDPFGGDYGINKDGDF